MATENTENGFCAIHNCPPEACPNDCPNRLVKAPTKAEVLELTGVAPKEVEYFSKDEVVREITVIAEAGGIKSGDLQPEPGGEKYNSEGKLAYLSMRVSPERARERKCGNIWFIYLVKGENGPIGSAETTCVYKADSTLDKPDDVDYAQIVLEYSDTEKKWIRR
jgi:hypothetical protein